MRRRRHPPEWPRTSEVRCSPWGTPAAASSVAVHDNTFHPVGAAESIGGGGHVAGVDARPDVGRRERHRMLGKQGLPVDRETEAFTDGAEHFHGPRGLLAESEVLPHDDLGDVQSLDEDFAGVALGRELHELGSERHHTEHVDAEFLGEFGAPGQGGQLGRMAPRTNHFHRVRVEGHQHTGDAPLLRRLHRTGDQLLVTSMHAVEHADRDHAPTPVRRYLVQTSPSLHIGKPTTPTTDRHPCLSLDPSGQP